MSNHQDTNLNKGIVISAAAVFVAAIIGLFVVFSPSLAAAQDATTNNLGNQTGTKPRTISGSINARHAFSNYIKEDVKVSFIDAANTAANQIDNGQVRSGNLEIVQGYLVYTFIISNTANDTGYFVIVDAGNGHVLYTSVGHALGGMFGFRGYERGMFGKQHEGLTMHHHNYPHIRYNNTISRSTSASGLIDGVQTNI